MTKKRKASASRRKPTRPTPKPKAPPRPKQAPVAPADVALIKTKGSKERGGGLGGEAWRIECGGKRAGVIFINMIEEAPIGRHASIQIFLNAASQGRGIGRIAYRSASDASQYDTIYAHMRKSNIASRKAAEHAGFVDVTPPTMPQLIMKRRRWPT